jgi:predicted ATPase
MILKKIDYYEFDNQPNYWSLKDVSLEKINLLVGKNATGKTRTITAISWLGNMIAGLQPMLLNSGNYEIAFQNNGGVLYEYSLYIAKQKVLSEKLIINGDEKLVRDENGIGTIFADELKQKIKFQIPQNQLVVVSRRDAIQHPYLAELSNWADGLRFYAFSSQLGKDTGFTTNDIIHLTVDPRDTNAVAALFAKGEYEFSEDFRNRIISAMKEIGYELSDIGVAHNPNIPLLIPNTTLFQMIYVIEKNSLAAIFQPEMSQGMFRALSLIIQVIYNTFKKCSTTILVDDIGEGLDFERSSNVINFLMETAQTNDIQIIMSTNDRFVMNNVPLEYWQVIQRTGGECRVYNCRNSAQIFDDFKYTGLSNFDFLSTDFINGQKDDQ